MDTSKSNQVERDQRKGDAPNFSFNAWIVYACSVGNYSLSIGLPLVTSTLFKKWQAEFDTTRAHTAAVYSTAFSILFGAAIIPGYVMNRLGARVTMLAGCAMAFLGCGMSCFAPSINFLIFSFGVLGGLGFCFVQLPSIPTISMVTKPKYRSIAVCVCTCGIALCTMSFPFLYRLLAHEYGWRGTFAIISAMSLQSMVFGLVMTSNVKPTSHPVDDTATRIKLKLLPKEKQTTPRTSDSGDVQKNSSFSESENSFLEHDKSWHCPHSHEDIQAMEQPPKPVGLLRRDNNAHTGSNSNTSNSNIDNSSINVNNSDVISNVNMRSSNGVDNGCSQKFVPLYRRVKSSRWRFLVDLTYILITLHICTCVAIMYSFVLMIMDFAYTKGFVDDAVGVFFIFVFSVSSLAGRLVIGPLNMISFLHSFILMGCFGAVAGIAVMALGSANEYSAIVGLMVVVGVSSGGVFGMYTKSVLDADSVDLSLYPLALGTAGTLEGIFDLFLPVLIGYVVDRTGSYQLILHVLGCLSLVTSLILVVSKAYCICHAHSRHENKFNADAESVS